jgi:hypothetical protein
MVIFPIRKIIFVVIFFFFFFLQSFFKFFLHVLKWHKIYSRQKKFTCDIFEIRNEDDIDILVVFLLEK